MQFIDSGLEVLNNTFSFSHETMKIVFLGTGGGFPSKERGVSSLAVRINGEVILLDCGEGTQRQLMESCLSYMKIKRIFITHFHGDHFLGIGGLIQSMCLNNRTAPLEIYGPEGTIGFMGMFLKLGYFNQTIPVTIHELASGDSLAFTHYSIRVLSMDHDIPALAYLVEEPMRKGKFDPEIAKQLGVKEGPDFRLLQSGKSIEVNGEMITPDLVMGPPRKGRRMIYTGDTRPVSELVDFAKGADVLIHESTFHSDLADRSMEFGHTTAQQAAELAKKANVGKLFLTHISNRYSRDPSPLLDEALEIFPNTEMARDFMDYVIPRND